MNMQIHPLSFLLLLLTACSPALDWREIRSVNAPFTIAMPAKPATATRPVNLNGIQVNMSMATAEADDILFAVGSAELPDAQLAPAALQAMKTALVKNIDGKLRHEKSSIQPGTTDIEATGVNAARQPRVLYARFITKDKRIYQLAVIGEEHAVPRDAVDTFFMSFKPY